MSIPLSQMVVSRNKKQVFFTSGCFFVINGRFFIFPPQHFNIKKLPPRGESFQIYFTLYLIVDLSDISEPFFHPVF